MKPEQNEMRLSFFEQLYRNAKDAMAEECDAMDRYMAQYQGSREIDGSAEPATAVRNITYELIEAQISSEIPQPKVSAQWYSEDGERKARTIELLCAQMRHRLPFAEMNDMDDRYTYIYGSGVWFVEWDESLVFGSEVGGVRITTVNPKDFLPQPGVARIEDMEYCFLRFHTTRAELMRKYGISTEEALHAECEADQPDLSVDQDTVCMILCFYKNENEEISTFAWSGDTVLLDLEDYYARKGEVCTHCGKEAALCLCAEPKFALQKREWEALPKSLLIAAGEDPDAFAHDKKSSSVHAHMQSRPTVPYYIPKQFPIVVRKNISKDGSVFGQSDCAFLRPQQMQINKLESRIMQKLLRAGVTPLVPEDAQITLNNSVFGQVIRMKPGEHTGMYGTIDTTPSITQDVLQSDRLYEHAKRILGISDTFLGLQDQSAISGKAKQVQVEQAQGRLESKRRMKHSAYAKIDRLIFSFYLAYADEPRNMVYKDAYGRLHHMQFNRYDFLSYDEKTGSLYYDDNFLFSIDEQGGIEQQRELLWEKNLENLRAGTLGDPALPITLLRYWQNQERAHYPHARENVEYFQEIVASEGSGVCAPASASSDLLFPEKGALSDHV